MESPVLAGFTDVSVAVAGTFEGRTRDRIEAALMASGAKVTARVTAKTGLLVIGSGADAQRAKAESLGVKVMEEDAFADLLDGDLEGIHRFSLFQRLSAWVQLLQARSDLTWERTLAVRKTSPHVKEAPGNHPADAAAFAQRAVYLGFSYRAASESAYVVGTEPASVGEVEDLPLLLSRDSSHGGLRERHWLAPHALSREQAEQFLWARFHDLRDELSASSTGDRHIELTLHDHRWTHRPWRPWIASLSWKDRGAELEPEVRIAAPPSRASGFLFLTLEGVRDERGVVLDFGKGVSAARSLEDGSILWGEEPVVRFASLTEYLTEGAKRGFGLDWQRREQESALAQLSLPMSTPLPEIRGELVGRGAKPEMADDLVKWLGKHAALLVPKE